MPTIVFRLDGDGVSRLTVAMEKLAGPKKTAALRRALNHTGDRAYTIVKRTISKQIGAPQSIIQRYGRLRPRKASSALLEYVIRSDGGPIPLKHFAPYQGRAGVTAAPWHNRKLYKSAFIVRSLGGHVFWRDGRKRLPITRIAGPNVPKELVKAETAAAFQMTVATRLVPRVEHEIRAITAGVVS